MDVSKFVINYIQRKYSIPADIDVMALNFVESGYVDSLGMIQFIIALEEQFNIEFIDEELDSPDFKIVGKLINIIENKISEEK